MKSFKFLILAFYLESIFGVVTILIGGYLSDISGRRKPLILYPIIGEFFAQVG